MTARPDRRSLHLALAACGAAIITFIGVCHESVGSVLFPWGPALLGGDVGWHGLGLFVIVAGLGALGGTLRLYRFPVVTMSWVAVVSGLGLVVFTAIVHHQFHLFALAAACAGGLTAYCHPRALATKARDRIAYPP